MIEHTAEDYERINRLLDPEDRVDPEKWRSKKEKLKGQVRKWRKRAARQLEERRRIRAAFMKRALEADDDENGALAPASAPALGLGTPELQYDPIKYPEARRPRTPNLPRVPQKLVKRAMRAREKKSITDPDEVAAALKREFQWVERARKPAVAWLRMLRELSSKTKSLRATLVRASGQERFDILNFWREERPYEIESVRTLLGYMRRTAMGLWKDLREKDSSGNYFGTISLVMKKGAGSVSMTDLGLLAKIFPREWTHDRPQRKLDLHSHFVARRRSAAESPFALDVRPPGARKAKARRRRTAERKRRSRKGGSRSRSGSRAVAEQEQAKAAAEVRSVEEERNVNDQDAAAGGVGGGGAVAGNEAAEAEATGSGELDVAAGDEEWKGGALPPVGRSPTRVTPEIASYNGFLARRFTNGPLSASQFTKLRANIKFPVWDDIKNRPPPKLRDHVAEQAEGLPSVRTLRKMLNAPHIERLKQVHDTVRRKNAEALTHHKTPKKGKGKRKNRRKKRYKRRT